MEANREYQPYAFGYRGLCELLDCSEATAWKILKSGTIDGAVSQVGRKIVINKEVALQLLTKKPNTNDCTK